VRPKGCILCYHAVGEVTSSHDQLNLVVSTEQFRAQMRFLSRRKRVVPLTALLEGDVPGDRPAVAITFDDAYRSVLTCAAPILEQHGFPATVFAPTKWIGLSMRWRENGSAPSWDTSILTADQLLELERRGISVESHGHAHADLAHMTAGEVRRDLESSVTVLTGILGRTPRFVAYPFGRSSPEARKIVAEMGFAAAFTVTPYHPEGPHEHGRVAVWPTDSVAMFALKSSGHYLNLRRSRMARAAFALTRRLFRRP
jgi:peptidoglycan/xylan/chitin deacetylase (PgdA/CDA1 family)